MNNSGQQQPSEDHARADHNTEGNDSRTSFSEDEATIQHTSSSNNDPPGNYRFDESNDNISSQSNSGPPSAVVPELDHDHEGEEGEMYSDDGDEEDSAFWSDEEGEWDEDDDEWV